MSTLTAGKIAEVLFENALETHEAETQILDLVDVFHPEDGAMQNSGNVIWRNVQQHAPVIEGWDLAGLETGIIEETYPATLGTPKNDFVQLRADNLRDIGFWERRGKESGRKQAATLNKAIADVIANTGTMFYRSNATSGFDFIAEAQALMNERQIAMDQRYFMLNDRDTKAFASDLAGRQTLQGRPEQEAWKKGQIGAGVAEFDLYTSSALLNLAGGADPATTVTGNQSFAPEGGSVNATTRVVTNVDYRTMSIPVAASGSYNVGDRVTIANSGTTVKALALMDKTDTGQAMTFTVVSKPDATTLELWPKAIALDDGSLSTEELAYANVDTTIDNAATVNRVNTDASNKTNIFWCKSSIEVTAGDIPGGLLAEFEGMKHITETLKSGLSMHMFYDANIENLQARWRLFTWYDVTNKAPHANGAAVTY